MKIRSKNLTIVLILKSSLIFSQISPDSLLTKINLNELLLNKKYKNTFLKKANRNVANKTSAIGGSDDYYFDELNALTASPEANNIFRVSQFNNDLYSGNQDVKIPLFTIQEGDIEIPIMLVYRSSGIKVDQRASEVGLGWSLITGPQINRKLNGVNDWFQTNHFNPWPRTNGYFRKIRENLPTVSNSYYMAESSPDEYFVTLKNGIRKFIFTDENTPLEVSTAGLKIQATSTVFPNFDEKQPKDFNQFKITDNDGLKYSFIDAGFKSITTYISDPVNYTETSNGEWPSVSDWKISTIEDPLNNRKVDFGYITNNNSKVYTSASENTTVKCSNMANVSEEKCIRILGIGVDPNPYKFYVNFTMAYLSKKKYISQIVFNSGKIVFNYDETTENLGSSVISKDYIVKSIEQFDNNNKLIKKFTFNYSTFNCLLNENEDGMCNERLKLVSLDESDKGKYEFSYNNLPLYAYGSTKFDFLGYHTDGQISDNGMGLYFYPGEKEWSILPYNLPIPPRTPDGQIERQKVKLFNNEQASSMSLRVLPSSAYAKAGILEKIKFPTGGEQVFDYESNDFLLFGKYEVQGAGLRLKETYLKDQNNYQKRIRYEYKDAITNKSSGLLLAPPFVGYPLKKFYIGTDFTEMMIEDEAYISASDFSLYNKNNSDADLINGSTIGYGRVIKRFDDGSFEESIFKNKNDDYELALVNYSNTSIFPGAAEDFNYGSFRNYNSAALVKYKDFGIYGNGNLLETKVYNSTGVLTQKITNNYRNIPYQTLEASYPYFSALATIYITTSSPPLPPNPYGVPWTYGTSKFKYLSYSNDIINSTRTDYYPSGSKSETVEYKYISDYSNKIRKIIKSDGVIVEKKYLFDSSYPAGSPERNIQYIFNNLYAIDSEKRTIKGKVLSNQTVKYNNFLVGYNKVPKPSEIYKETLNGNPDNVLKIISYNSKGKVVETLADDIPSVTIWGYNDTLPIAKIIGANYNQVSAAATDIINKSNIDIDNVSENNLISALDAFRTNPNFNAFKITTYTYDPLIGVTSITQPSGTREIYKYDLKNRLEKVVDVDGNIIKEHKYNYKH